MVSTRRNIKDALDANDSFDATVLADRKPCGNFVRMPEEGLEPTPGYPDGVLNRKFRHASQAGNAADDSNKLDSYRTPAHPESLQSDPALRVLLRNPIMLTPI